MEKIQKLYEKISSQDLSLIADILSTEDKAVKKKRDQIINTILTFNGLDALLSSLSNESLTIFYNSVISEKGITFSEIEKQKVLTIGSIEASSNELKKLLLCYIIKNRKLLTNKFDKVIIFNPIKDIVNPYNSEKIRDKIKSITQLIFDKGSEPTEDLIKPEKKYHLLLENIFQQGGFISLHEFKRLDTDNNSEKLLNELIKKDYIEVAHFFSEGYVTFIILKDPLIKFFVNNSHVEDKISVNNSFSFLNNLLYTFDTVSSYGLFLTRLNEFRKNDLKRISTALLPLKNIDGFNIPEDQTTLLLLFIASSMDYCTINKDEVIFNLDDMQGLLTDPYGLSKKIINSLKDQGEKNSVFQSPFKVPQHSSIKLIYKILNKIDNIDREILSTLFILMKSVEHEESVENIAYYRKYFSDEFNNAFRFLLITGITEIKSGLCKLTDHGKIILGDSSKEKAEFDYNEIYINPDFTIMVPFQETPAEILYMILSYTEIYKHDVVIHTRISKESILHAYKRGMKPESFIDCLSKYAKNEIPQNLSFLITEWIDQTLKLNIKHVTLLKSSKKEFIEDIQNHKELSRAIVEVISPEYAIIKKDFVDEIIREAKKQDAMISLLGEV